MKILIIDDDKYKSNSIKRDLEKLLDSPVIEVQRARNPGLCAIMDANKRHKSEPFDLVIVDNYMPLFEDEYDIEPYAKDILRELDRLEIDVPAIVCSSESLGNDWIPRFIICYDISVDGTSYFRPILTELGFIKN